MSQQQEPVRINPEAPYAIPGYAILDAIRILQEMPRSTEGFCRQIEDILARVQPLTIQQPEEETPQEPVEGDAPVEVPPNS